MTYADLTDFLDDDGLHITIKGKDYLVPSPDAETGLRFAAMAAVGAKMKAGQHVPPEQLKSLELNDDQEQSFIRQVLGPVTDQLIADGFSWVAMSRVAQYAFTHFSVSPDTARKALKAGVFVTGKAPARKPGKQTGAARTTGTASTGSRKTKPRASSTGRSSSSTGA